jgi:hypothetical protein
MYQSPPLFNTEGLLLEQIWTVTRTKNKRSKTKIHLTSRRIKKHRKRATSNLKNKNKTKFIEEKMIIVTRIWKRKTENGESGEGKEHKRKNEYHNEENLKRRLKIN